MPLTTRRIDMYFQRPKAKSKPDRILSPITPINHPHQIIESQLRSQGKSPTNSIFPSTISSGSKSKRKNMYSVISCRALLKKARQIGPTQSYLPNIERSPVKDVVQKSSKSRQKQNKRRKGRQQDMESHRILIQSKNSDIKQGDEAAKKAKESKIFDRSMEEESSLTKLILFGVEDSVKFKPLKERISNGQLQLLNCLKMLQKSKETEQVVDDSNRS